MMGLEKVNREMAVGHTQIKTDKQKVLLVRCWGGVSERNLFYIFEVVVL